MLILSGIIILTVVIAGTILNRVTLYNIRKNAWRAKEITTIMQRTLNENSYVVRLNLQEHKAVNLYGNFLPAEGMTYEESLAYVHPDDRLLYQAFLSSMAKGIGSRKCIFRWDTSLDRHEHTWRYLSDVGVVEYDEADPTKPKNFYCALCDLTEQMQAENKEKELTDRYRKLFEQSIVGQAFYDKNGRLVTANKKMREILKFKNKHDSYYYQHTFFDLPKFRYAMEEDGKEDLYFCTKTVIYERDVNCFTEVHITPVFNDANELEFYTMYMRDVTQERELYLQNKANEASLQHTNHEIKQYERELKYLLENVNMRFFRTSFEKREVTFYRENSTRESHMSFDELKEHLEGTPFAKGLDHPTESFSEPWSILAPTRPFFNQGDEQEWNYIDCIPYYDENGEQVGNYGVIRNVTDLINKQEQLKEETERANTSGLRKSTFLASMSHEIRTPLNAIVGFSDVLATMSSPEEREGIIQVISNNCDMLLRLVNDILALSSLENGDVWVKPEETDFVKCFNNVATSLAQRVKNPRVHFEVESPLEHYETLIDGGRIQQVITNFVTNAIKYTRQGHIKIGYEQQTRHQQEGLYIYCEDTGEGIPKAYQKKVFDRFVKLNEFIQGTGLGLSISKIIAQKSGGEIGVISEGEGKGSTFWIWIPCKQITTLQS